MIGFVLLWLGLVGGQGQTKCPNGTLVLVHNGGGFECLDWVKDAHNGFVWPSDSAKYCCHRIRADEPKPVEHVIEIRTKRAKRKIALSNYQDCIPGDEHLLVEHNQVYCVAEQGTKTLYIDGQKVGIIKEVEEK